MDLTTTFTGPTQSVTITRAPAVDSSYRFDRLNHISKRLAGGNQFTLDMGPNLLVGELRFNNVKGVEARALMQLVSVDLRYTLRSVTIAPPFCVDLGVDLGQPITCRLNNVKSTGTMFTKANVVDRWNIIIPYELVVADERVGLGVDGVA